MEFEETRIYRAIVEEPVGKVANKVLDLLKCGRDVNLRGSDGSTFMHVLVEHWEKFSDPRALPVVYQLAYAGIDINAQDDRGETCLHKIMRKDGAAKIMVAIMR